MKKVVSYLELLALGAAVLSTAACSQKDPEGVVAQMSALEVYGGVSTATKAVDQTWSVGDRIGVMGGTYLNALYVLDETQATVVGHFSAAEDHTIYLGGAETVMFTAYGPYQTSAGPNAYPGDSADGVVSGSTAAQGSVAEQETIDFLYASGQGASPSYPKVDFTFTHQMSKLVLKVVYGEGLSAAILQYDDNDFQLDGLLHSGTFDVKDGTAAADGAATANWDLNTGCVKEDIADGVQFTSIIFPQEPELAITVKVNDEEFDRTTLPVPSGGFVSGMAYVYTITVNENGLVVGSADGGCQISAWDVVGEDDEDYHVNIGGN